MTPLYKIPDEPSALELVSKHFSDPNPAVAALARLAAKARQRAVVACAFISRGSDGAGGIVIEDMYAASLARALFDESVAETSHYVSELASLVASKEKAS